MEPNPQFAQPVASPMAQLTPHDIEVVLNEATKAEPELGTVTSLDNSSWLIELTSGDEILAEWATNPPRLVLTTALGRPEPEHELLAYKLALTYNAQWHQNGPLRIARDHADGELLILTDLHESELHMPELAGGLMRLEVVRSLWTLALQGMDPSVPALATAPAIPGDRV
jgi:hypothetical protein